MPRRARDPSRRPPPLRSSSSASSNASPGHVEHDLAEHLHEAAVRVEREALVLRLLRQPVHRRVVHPEVEDRVHHPGHRERRAGAHGDEQRVALVAELLAHLGLERLERRRDLVHQALGQPVAAGHVGVAGLGGDREPGRYRQAELGHLGEVRSLASEQVLLLLRALLEGVHILHWITFRASVRWRCGRARTSLPRPVRRASPTCQPSTTMVFARRSWRPW